MKFPKKIATSSTLMALAGLASTAAAEPEQDQQIQVIAAAHQTEVFGVSFEVWSPHLVKEGYWSSARFGLGFGLAAFSESTANGERHHVRTEDYSAGYMIESRQAGFVRFHSVFQAGGARMDRHAKGVDMPLDPTSYGYFDTRQGFSFLPPTHENGPIQDSSRLDVGAGFRWNFIGSSRALSAGDSQIREMQIYPYLAANMFI